MGCRAAKGSAKGRQTQTNKLNKTIGAEGIDGNGMKAKTTFCLCLSGMSFHQSINSINSIFFNN